MTVLQLEKDTIVSSTEILIEHPLHYVCNVWSQRLACTCVDIHFIYSVKGHSCALKIDQ